MWPFCSQNFIIIFHMGHPGPLFSLFSVYTNKQSMQFLQQINVKNIHPVSGTGIRTDNLLNTIRLPLPQDQGCQLLW